MFQVKWIASLEVDGVLAALGSEPEPILAPEYVDMFLAHAGRNHRAVDPSKTKPVTTRGGACQHPPLHTRADGDLRLAGLIGKHQQVRMLTQKGHVISKRGRGGLLIHFHSVLGLVACHKQRKHEHAATGAVCHIWPPLLTVDGILRFAPALPPSGNPPLECLTWCGFSGLKARLTKRFMA